MTLERNVGGYDRGARLVVGAVLSVGGFATWFLVSSATVRAGAAVAVLLGMLALFTGITASSFLYAAMDVDTTTGGSDEEPAD